MKGLSSRPASIKWVVALLTSARPALIDLGTPCPF